MAGMDAKDPLDLLNQKLRAMMNEYVDTIGLGGCKNFPDYTHLTGVVEGLALAERELKDIQKMMNEN